MKKIKISIISDSISMPRLIKKGESVYIDDTWPEILKNKLKDKYRLYNFPKRARTSYSLTSTDVLNESVNFVLPEILIIQIGIVDCSPRIFSNLEKRIIFSSYFPKFLRNHIRMERKRKNKNKMIKDYKVLVSPADFEKNLNFFLNTINQNLKIIIIPIIGNIKKLENFRPSYKKNISTYNKILKNFASKDILFHSDILKNISNDFFCDDGYHLSKIGHKKLSKLILDFINVQVSTKFT